MVINDPAKLRVLKFCSVTKSKHIAEEVLQRLLENKFVFKDDKEKFFLAEALLRLYYEQFCRNDLKWAHYKECRDFLRNKHRAGEYHGTN